MRINGRVVPRELKKYFLVTFISYLIALFLLIPIAVYVISPCIVLIFHGIPIAATQARAIGMDKICTLVLFASLWISLVLWVREFIIWYRAPSSEDQGQFIKISDNKFQRWRSSRNKKK
jgi:hypothetical protein